MIYIPRFQKRKRLDTRGGMSSNVPVVTPASALRADALSRVLDNVSTKLIPAIAGYMAEEKKENEKTELLNFKSDILEKMGSMPADAKADWFSNNVTPYFEDKIKTIEDENLKAKFREEFVKKKVGFERNYIAKTHPMLFERKQKNARLEFQDSVKELDYSSAQGQKQFNMSVNNYFEAATEAFMWDYEQKTGKKATKEIVDNEEYRSYISEIEETISSAAKSGVKRQIKTLASSTDIPTEEIVKNLESWAKGKPLKKDKKGESPYSFLYTLEDADVDKKTFVTELHESIIKGEQSQNAILALDDAREKRERREEFDSIMSGVSEVVTANVNTPSDYDTNEEKFNKLQDRVKVFLKTYPEAHKYKSLKNIMVPNAYNNLRETYVKSLDTRNKLDSFKEAIDLWNEGKINITDSSGIMDQLEEKGIKEDHVIGATNFLQKLHSSKNKKEIAKVSAFVSNLKSTLISLDQSDTFGATTSGGMDLPSADDAAAHTNMAMFSQNKNKSFTRRRKKTRYEMVLYQAEKGFTSLVNRLISGELSNNPKDDNYIGKEINNVYYHDVYVPLKEILKKDMHRHIVPQLNSSGSYKNLKNLMKGFNSPLFDSRDSNDKDEHLTDLYYYVGEHFTNLKNKASKSKRVTSETLNKTRSILTTISLMRKLPEDIIDATKQIASIRTDVSLDPVKNVAENKRRNK